MEPEDKRGIDEAESALTCGALRLDPRSSSIYRRGFGTRLGKHEYQVLEALMTADGSVVSSLDLIAAAGYDPDSQGLAKVRNSIGRLRRKLGDPRFIETIGGEGYRINPMR